MKHAIAPYVPFAESYVEPFCGAASLFFHRHPSPIEVLNDLDENLINFFRHLQDTLLSQQLEQMLRYTLYSRNEFGKAIATLKNPAATNLEKAWAFFVAKNCGMSGDADYESQWSRSPGVSRDVPLIFSKKVSMIEQYHERLKNVFIDRQDALKCMRYWDNQDCVFYCDPPYSHDTRAKGHLAKYANEMTCADHEKMVECLLELRGAVVLSGYQHDVYQPLLDAGWEIIRLETTCNAAGKVRGSQLRGEGAAKQNAARTECLWRNPRAIEMSKENLELF
jgi:DNA adenine methylase